MDSYRVENEAGIQIQALDKIAAMERVPTIGALAASTSQCQGQTPRQ